MASSVQIANLALAKIGAYRIAAFTDATKEARAVTAVFDLVRDEVLELFGWSFALKRAALAQLADVPAFGYDHAYQLPADYLSIIELYEVASDYRIEAGALLTDEDSVSIRYIYRVTDPSKFSPGFVAAFASKLAVYMATMVAGNNNLAAALERQFQADLSSAISIDANVQPRVPADNNGYAGSREA